MKKAIIFALAFVAVLGVSAMATDTRTMVMGNNNNIMLDDANVGLYPSRIANYPNLAFGEISNYGDGYYYSQDLYQVGVNWKFGEENPWFLGTYFSTDGDFLPLDYFGNQMMEWDELGWLRDYYGEGGYPSAKAADMAYLPSSRSFDLVYGRTFGTYNFGFSFGYNHSSYSSDVDSTATTSIDQEKESFSTMAFGVGLTPTTGKWDIALKFMTGSWTDETFRGEMESEPDGFSDLTIMGRYFHKYNNTITFVPHVMASMGKRGVDYNDLDNDTLFFGYYDYKQSRTAFEVGCGMNYTPVTNVLAVIDFGLQYEKIKTEYEETADSSGEATDSWTAFPYFRVGVEGEVFSWLDARMGVTSDFASYKYKDEGDGYNYKYGDIVNTTYLGAGFNFNRLHIDTYMDPQLLLDGFDFVSGNSNTGQMNFEVSVLYEMF